MPKKQLKSNCCNAPIDTISTDEGTSFYRCSKCCRGCDPKSRVKQVKPPVEPQIATDEEARQMAEHLESVASFKRSGTKYDDFEHKSFKELFGKDRPCPKECKGDSKHLHATLTTSEPVRWYDKTTGKNHKSIERAAIVHIFRRLMLVLVGMMIVLGWQKFQYNSCNEAATHVVDKLFLRK